MYGQKQPVIRNFGSEGIGKPGVERIQGFPVSADVHRPVTEPHDLPQIIRFRGSDRRDRGCRAHGIDVADAGVEGLISEIR